MKQRIGEILSAWATERGTAFVWEPDRVIAYTNSRGAWHLSTQALNGEDDWISVHPTEAGCELEKVADAGHVEVLRLSPEQLETELEGILAWFAGWTGFMSSGPGVGH